jgi:hypothetical protein
LIVPTIFFLAFPQVCRRRLKVVLRASLNRDRDAAAAKASGKSNPGVDLLAKLPAHLSAWVAEASDSGDGAGPVRECPVSATCALMRMAAELIRTSNDSSRQAALAMETVETLQQ